VANPGRNRTFLTSFQAGSEQTRSPNRFGDLVLSTVAVGFTRHGETDLKINQDDAFSMGENPDFIVMIFLDRAIETGPAKLEQVS
jgi:hypothetical protein